jgi:hypothetical protein
MSLEPPALDPAAQAFERLRLEVALLRRAVEGLAGEGQRRAPDYSPTLAKLGKAIGAVDERVQVLADNPTLTLSPARLGQLFKQGADNVMAPAVAELGRDRAAFAEATRRLDGVSQAWRTHQSRWRLAARLGAAGMVLGAVLWAALLGPAARALPAGWQVPERLAAATLAMPRQAAGERLVHGADPAGWRRMRLGAAIVGAEPKLAEACAVRAAKTGRTVRCEVEVPPEIGAWFAAARGPQGN